MLIGRAGRAAPGQWQRGGPVGGALVGGAGLGAGPHHSDGPVKLVGDSLGALHGVDGSAPPSALVFCVTLGRSPTHSEPRLHPGVPAWHPGQTAGPAQTGAARQKGVLTTSGARVSGRLALGEILATGDVLCPVDFSVGGEVVGRPDWEALRRVGGAAPPTPRAPRSCRVQLSGLLSLRAPCLWGLAPGWSSWASSWPSSVFSLMAFRAPGEGSSRGEGGSEAPSLHWGLSLTPEGRQRQGG